MKQLALTRDLACAALAVLALTACHSLDPLYSGRSYTPGHSNADDLAAMVADPADLTHGKSANGSWSPGAITAVNRLTTHTVLPLPSSYVTKVETTGDSGGDAAAPTTPASGTP